jgi:hypothetical protein
MSFFFILDTCDSVSIKIDTIRKNIISSNKIQYYNSFFVNSRIHIIFNASVSFYNLKDETNALNYFLSFINGRWTSIFYWESIDNNYKLYEDPFIQAFCSQPATFDLYLKFNEGCLDDAYKKFKSFWATPVQNKF